MCFAPFYFLRAFNPQLPLSHLLLLGVASKSPSPGEGQIKEYAPFEEIYIHLKRGLKFTNFKAVRSCVEYTTKTQSCVIK